MLVWNDMMVSGGQGIVFQPALAPLEAAMLPAREWPMTGALCHVKRETARWFCWDGCDQRTKIWVK